MTQLEQAEQNKIVKHYKGKELASLYGINIATFKRWLRPFEEELGTKSGVYYTVAQVQMIFDKLGTPIGVGRELVKEKTISETSKDFLTDSAWLFAKTVLWQKRIFSEKEEEQTKEYILAYFESAEEGNADARFISMCERILLAKSYVQGKVNRYITHPLLWFNPAYSKGFTGTLDWYKKLVKFRSSQRCFTRHHLLAELYLKYMHDPELDILLYCIEKLTNTGDKEILEIFMTATSDLASYLLKEIIALKYRGGNHA